MTFKIVSIGLKIAEIVLLLTATGLIGYFVKESHDEEKEANSKITGYDLGRYGRHEFFLYSTCVGVIIAILGLLALITEKNEKNGGPLVMVAVHALWTLQLLVASALLAKVLATYKEDIGKTPSYCDLFDKGDKDYQCSQVTGGVVCGFLAVVLFVADTVIYCISCKRST